MRVIFWNIAWVFIGPGTLALAVFGTDAAYRAATPQPELKSFHDGEQGFADWERANKTWYDSKETLVWQVLIGTAILDVFLYFLVRHYLVAWDNPKK